MKELQQYINTYFGISPEEMEKVASLFQESELKKVDFFLKTGQYCDKLSFIQSGFIRIFASYKDKEITQWISTKGYFLTDLYSFYFNQRARWNIQALSDCKLYTIHKENYQSLNRLVPNWQEMENKFISGCFVILEDRVFNHLSLSAEERYDQLFAFNKELFQQVPQQYLASMLGISPETFSRIRNKRTSKKIS